MCVLQLLRKSYNELKLLEAVKVEDIDQTDSYHEVTEQVAAGLQQELIEKVLKNVAIASEVLEYCLPVNVLDLTDCQL